MKKLVVIILTVLAVTGCYNGKKIVAETPNTTGNVVQTQRVACALSEDFDGIPDLSREADTIVVGNVDGTQSFVSSNGLIWTQEKICLVDVLKGNAKSNEIFVYRMGGTATVEEYLNSFEPNIRKLKAQQYEKFGKTDLIEQI